MRPGLARYFSPKGPRTRSLVMKKLYAKASFHCSMLCVVWLFAVGQGFAQDAASGKPSPAPQADKSAVEANPELKKAKEEYEALEAKQRVQYLKELEKLGPAMRKRKIDISFGMEAGGKNVDQNLNEGIGWEEVIVAAAVLDSGYDMVKFHANYPEISRRSAVCAMEDFEQSGTKQALYRRMTYNSVLQFQMIRPDALRADRDKLTFGYFRTDDFIGDCPLKIIHRDKKIYVRVLGQSRPLKVGNGADGPTMFRRWVTEFIFSGGEWREANKSIQELPEAEWVPLDQVWKPDQSSKK